MQNESGSSLELPLVSVVMPVRNEAGFIARSLGAVLAQTYPAERMEVLIADGMSTDGTRQEIERLSAANARILVTIVDNPQHIVATGLNAVMRQARGDIIIRVDGHCEIAPDYVATCVRQLAETGVDGVGGPIDTIGSTPLSETIALAMASGFGVGGSAFRVVKDRAVEADTIPFPAYRREIVERVGAYDEELVRNQDDEYNYRLRARGGKLLLSPLIRSRYYSRGTMRSLWRQYFQYGYWKVRVLQKHPRQMQWRQFVPPLFVSALGGSAALALVSKLGRWLLVLVTGLYAAVNLAASVRAASRHGWRHLAWLPPVFATLHLSYGMGFLRGLVRFRDRWGRDGDEAGSL